MKSMLNKFLFTLLIETLCLDCQLLFSPSSWPLATLLVLSNLMGLTVESCSICTSVTVLFHLAPYLNYCNYIVNPNI